MVIIVGAICQNLIHIQSHQDSFLYFKDALMHSENFCKLFMHSGLNNVWECFTVEEWQIANLLVPLHEQTNKQINFFVNHNLRIQGEI